ncbi:MAG: outer membrane beta-barrel protein [Deltaproteobacteria bacterium]|jgi:opacity protein-like surface antigen|nr:outer membrane beta-barrel protein [Deltaproteobacteria bacterium]
MKRVILCFVAAAALALPALASAEVSGVYLAPRFLVGIQDSGQFSRSGLPSDSFSQYSRAVFGGALALGYSFAPKFNMPVRAEVEYALRSNSNDSRDGNGWSTKHTLNISTLFFNAYLDIPTGTPFTPFVGGGLGMSFNYTGISGRVGTNHWDLDQRDTNFAWNVGAGLSYAFTENVAADLGYRFIGAGHREISSWGAKVSSSPYINEFYLGARIGF